MIQRIRKQLRKNRGFTLVELMIVVAIVGILAALAIYGIRRYVTNAKTAEARNSLGQLGKDASGAYYKEGMNPSVLALGASAVGANALCASVTAKVPSAASSIKNSKYQSSPNDWGSNGWTCLRFSMNDPQYYMYNYSTTGTTAADSVFTCSAQGDLDGDSVLSTFALKGSLKAASGTIIPVLAPNIEETNPDE